MLDQRQGETLCCAVPAAVKEVNQGDVTWPLFEMHPLVFLGWSAIGEVVVTDARALGRVAE